MIIIIQVIKKHLKKSMKNNQTTDFSKKDIINDEKIKLENINIDKQ